MAKQCTVCAHAEANAINEQLLEGVPRPISKGARAYNIVLATPQEAYTVATLQSAGRAKNRRR